MSDGMTTLEQNIARLEAATTASKQAAREARSAAKEAHEALRALQRERRDLAEWVAAETERVTTHFKEMFDNEAAPVVQEGLARYAETIQKAQDASVAAVNESFKKLTNVMLYGNLEGTGDSLVGLALQRQGRASLARVEIDLDLDDPDPEVHVHRAKKKRKRK